jgi:DnaJ-class molecular chaperone with C-terminal Zn finger domain
MQGRPGQEPMTEKESYAILEVPEGSGLDVVKRSYRRLAFALHPDLNPGLKGAALRFRRLNEAYVCLSQTLARGAVQDREEPSARKPAPEKPPSGKSYAGRGGYFGSRGGEKADPDGKAGKKNKEKSEKARKAYEKASSGREDDESYKRRASDSGEAGEQEQKEVLHDILQDPFARRVFEDIYSHIKQDREKKQKETNEPQFANANQPGERPASGERLATPLSGGLPAAVSRLKSWARHQIDDEQVLRLPGSQILPGARVRLHIQHGLSGEPQTIEVKLPPHFTPGMTMRLKGLGKRVCGLAGDLYVRIEAQ